MGNSGDNKHVPDLIDHLQDENGNARRLAASALGKLGDRRAVEPLLDLLATEEKPQVRMYAVKALGQNDFPGRKYNGSWRWSRDWANFGN